MNLLNTNSDLIFVVFAYTSATPQYGISVGSPVHPTHWNFPST